MYAYKAARALVWIYIDNDDSEVQGITTKMSLQVMFPLHNK
jgi:hypothetical protein